MENRRSFLPERWPCLAALGALASVAGNLCIRYFPWPAFMRESYAQAAEVSARGGLPFLAAALFLGPVFEEAAFRVGPFGVLRRRFGFWPCAVLSSLAFGLYHGNWIQGIYGFIMGMLFAWGYETSAYGKYAAAVLMHGAANLAALAVFG